jgi:hypothetical protein
MKRQTENQTLYHGNCTCCKQESTFEYIGRNLIGNNKEKLANCSKCYSTITLDLMHQPVIEGDK